MSDDKLVLLKSNYNKLIKAIDLVLHSIKKIKNINNIEQLSIDEQEPYDALVSRFERAVEIALNKFFRSIELYEYVLISDILRDRLNNIQKLNLITDVELWLKMQDIRNRIAHDYLPDRVSEIYSDIIKYSKELEYLLEESENYINRIESNADN